MKRQNDKQEITLLLSKFMAGETSVAEEQMLAHYFRTHDVDEEWVEFKEIFALFDSGEVDIELETGTSDQLNNGDCGKIRMLPKAVKGKPKIAVLRWLMVGIAASLALLVVFHLGRITAEQPTLAAENSVVVKDSVQPKQEVITPTERTEEVLIVQTTPAKSRSKTEPMAPKASSASSAEELANCIARLEAEMENLDDSVNSKHVEKLIAADARLQQMVNRIVGKQVEQAINEIKKDTTTNYISF